MQIRELEQHCGKCDIGEFCGTDFGYCLCCDKRFGEMEVSEYRRIAATATGIKALQVCEGCTRPDCDVYAYDGGDYADDPCEHIDDAQDYYCRQVADFVEASMKEEGQ